jgi:hypothetical protein
MTKAPIEKISIEAAATSLIILISSRIFVSIASAATSIVLLIFNKKSHILIIKINISHSGYEM